jgi:uncharacterized protein YbjT (DUF2867 family)
MKVKVVETSRMTSKAIILGASGLIGGQLLDQLLQHPSYSEVLILVRKELAVNHPKLRQLVVNFDNLTSYSSQITGNIVFCCIGTTKSKTPDQTEYRKIDYQYPLDLARIAQANGAESYHLVSAMGADATSSIFYSKTKGEVERDLKTIPFKSIYIYQPSLLVGDRKEKRLMEKIMAKVMDLINPLLGGSLKKYRSIHVKNVAKAMLHESLTGKRGTFIYTSDQVENLSH